MSPHRANSPGSHLPLPDPRERLLQWVMRSPRRASIEEILVGLAEITEADAVFVGVLVGSPGGEPAGAPRLRFVHALLGRQPAQWPDTIVRDQDAWPAPFAAAVHTVVPLLRCDVWVGALGLGYADGTVARVDEDVLALLGERVAAILERERSEHEIAALFDLAPDALLVADARGRIVRANRSAAQTFGRTVDELVTLGIEDLVPTDARDRHAGLRAAFATQDRGSRFMGVHRPGLWALRGDGRQVPVEVALGATQIEGQPCVIASVRDVTERLRAQEERARLDDVVRHAQKMESLGTLAGGVAHDFNNLLTIVQTHVELALHWPARDAVLHEHLEAIATATKRGRGLTRQLLQVCRRSPPSRVWTQMEEVIREVLTLMRATIPSGIELRFTHTDVPPVLVDPTQLHQVLVNLLTNAWQSIPRSLGEVAVTLEPTVVDETRAARLGIQPGTYAQITVRDTGVGIPEEVRSRIFEPFFTTKAPGHGSGLGLAVSHSVITQHEGAIEVESRLGDGAAFIVLLPLGSAAARAEKVSAELPSPRRLTLRVLLVDDEPHVVRGTTWVLESLGCTVVACTTAAAAIAHLRSSESFDALLTDQHMPEMSGDELALIAASTTPPLPVVLMSGNHTVDTTSRATVVRLDKPFTADELRDALVRACQRGGGTGDERER
ncbi:MAG: PAS domain S-box protein [Deltaproteobacteria bacterium]|nr:PAS domain S-box protein [Deltaproteobacteria bacterium]